MAIAYLSACGFLLFRQNRLIFFPSPVIETTPAAFNLAYQDVWVPVTASGKTEQLHAWWIPAAELEIGVMLHLHGNGVNIGANVSQAYWFHQLGFSVLLIDYRGYGLSQGAFPTEASVYQDVQAAWNYLIQEQQIPAEHIFIYGHSLGAAIAIDLAVKQPEAAGLIVQSSFTSIQEMMEFTGSFWMFPSNLLLTQRFDSINKIRSGSAPNEQPLQIPVLFIHGMADGQVPAVMSQLLYDTAPQPKQLFLVPEAGHNDVADVAGQEYLETIRQFVEQVRKRQTQAVQQL